MQPFSCARVPALDAGPGALERLIDLLGTSVAGAVGLSSVAIVHGASWFPRSRFAESVDRPRNGVRVRRFTHTGEPSPEAIDAIASELRQDPPETVIAVGGGSVLDTGKAVAAMVCETGSVAEYLEGVGNRVVSGRRLNLVAVPTTAGTGSEATRNAVVSRVGRDGFKKSLRHDAFVPDYAVIDPLLSVGCPRDVTVASGLDAVTQLLEAYVSSRASAFTGPLAAAGLRAAARAFPGVANHPEDLDLRFEMAFAAYLSGVVLADAGLGVVHGLASPIGSLVPAPHGAVCAALLPAATRVITAALTDRDSGSETGRIALRRYAEAGDIITGETHEDVGSGVEALVATLDRWVGELGVPTLDAWGIGPDDVSDIVARGSRKNTPVDLTADEIESIVLEAVRR